MSKATTESVQTSASLVHLVGREEPQTYAAGIELFRQGALVENAYVIAEGIVKLSHVSSDGRPTILGLRTEGWILGAAAATCSALHPVTATTLTRSRLHRVSASRFRTFLRRRASLSWYVHEMHSREIHEQLMQVVDLRSLSARSRLERLLQRFMPQDVEAKESVRLQLPLRMWEVAQLVAITPSYLSDLLRCLEQEGVLRRNRGWVVILDPQRLPSGDQ